jgi:hypothetical protein
VTTSNVDTKALATRLVVLKFILDQLVPAQRVLRTQAAEALAPKDRVTAPGPDGYPLGTITKSRPNPQATVSNEHEYADWMAAHYPDQVQHEWRITDTAAAVAVLRVHAPELLSRVISVHPWATAHVLKMSATAGRPVGPGGELNVIGVDVTRGPGTISVRIEQDAHDLIADLITAGLVTLDGTLREIAGGDR